VTTILEYVPMSEVSKYFIAADVAALPYRYFDAQSGVGSIALAFGLPMIVSKVGGLPELVLDDRAKIEADDVSDLSDKLLAILTNPTIAKKLSDDARILSEKNSWSRAVEATLLVYDEAVAG